MMIFCENTPSFAPWAPKLSENYRADEAILATLLVEQGELATPRVRLIQSRARQLVTQIRAGRQKSGGIDAFMQEYDLSTREGIVLMCLAESLLRIPDAQTADELIEDKLQGVNWEKHLGESSSLFVNASTLGLLISGRILEEDEHPEHFFHSVWHNLLKRSGEPVIRLALQQAMRLMGSQFVLGRTMEEALDVAKKGALQGYCYSFDMLGEAARTREAADQYFIAYKKAIEILAEHQSGLGPMAENGISIKLSALHPRYEMAQRERVLAELVPMVRELALLACAANIGFTIDAEETDRLELSLEVIEQVFCDPVLHHGWTGFGVAVQAYQKRALDVLDILITMTKKAGRTMMVRLVKGAYWDSEIKWAQTQGQTDYPVYTRKVTTDVSYLACARKMLDNPQSLYCQFATHNAYSVAAVEHLAGDQHFEFQRLHGMGEALYDQIVEKRRVRIYAPVGSHDDLLSYLVRRLLENGANSSFVHHLTNDTTPISEIIQDPVHDLHVMKSSRNPDLPVPPALYGASRKNARTLDLSDSTVLSDLNNLLSTFSLPLPPEETALDMLAQVFETVTRSPEVWARQEAVFRANCLRKCADLLETHMVELMALCVLEARKTIADSLGEVREAVDFLRYYAEQGEILFAKPQQMNGPTGEHNELQLHGRGVFVCISPWNFPLAIFVGQLAAALMAGNTVVAKPAEQTPRIAKRAVDLFYQAGLPRDVLQLVYGPGEIVGPPLLSHQKVAGVCFTGSHVTARIINLTLAKRDGPIVPLIAETGGQNIMIVDSTALLEATVLDVMQSAFGSAGQRCSALRVLYLQEEIADPFLNLLKGAMDELKVGNPALISTDIGPVIDIGAQQALLDHIADMRQRATFVHQIPVPDEPDFVAPHVFEIKKIADVGGEHFGPILHVIRYHHDELDDLIEQINEAGYGLTCGLQTRIDSKTRYIQSRLKVGNCYVNRNMVGAVVGVQPFGGEGLSGTGPKAGGPHYLMRFVQERTLTINKTAAGGNTDLLTMENYK